MELQDWLYPTLTLSLTFHICKVEAVIISMIRIVHKITHLWCLAQYHEELIDAQQIVTAIILSHEKDLQKTIHDIKTSWLLSLFNCHRPACLHPSLHREN